MGIALDEWRIIERALIQIWIAGRAGWLPGALVS